MAKTKDGYAYNGNQVDGSGIESYGPVRVYQDVVDASAGGTAQVTSLCTIPANSIILDVVVEVLEAFDGDTTTTLEVGDNGNPDDYIDTLDFDPSAAVGTRGGSFGGTTNDTKALTRLAAAQDVEALWTNTANATAGKVLVKITWLDLFDMGRDSQRIGE